MHLDRRSFLGAVGATTAATVAAPLTSAEAAPTVRRTLANGLSIPWGLDFLPNGDALVSERGSGDVFRVRQGGGKRLIGTVDEAVEFGEGGLLGVAMAPTFSEDRWVYFYVTTSDDNRVIRKQYVDGGLGPTEVLLDGIARTFQGSQNHHGGRLAFGPTGHLFVTTGDAGLSSRSQDEDSLNGKILRLDADGGIPSDNPIPGNPLWTLGHRNVQGVDWDRNGRMWATEFGQNTRDELNRILPGRNYGWPNVEGGDGDGPYADPLVTWQPTSTCSPSGLAIAEDRAWVGALAGQALFSVNLFGSDRGRKRRFLHNTLGRIRTVRRHPDDGALWITTSNGSNDRVLRVTL